MAPGASKTWHWNNANPLTVSYEVGFEPAGDTSGAACEFEVTRSWYAQQWGGEREFWFTVTNVGDLTCATQVILVSLAPLSSWSTGVLGSGVSYTTHWNNANPLTAAHLVGLSPTGATSSDPCVFEVVRTWYEEQPSGEREFWFTVKNVGAIACSVGIRLARNLNDPFVGAQHQLAAGQTSTLAFNPAVTGAHAYLPGLILTGATATTACRVEIVRYWYDAMDLGSSLDLVFLVTYKNIGSIGCGVTVSITRLV